MTILTLAPTQHLQNLRREQRSRNDTAYTIYDIRTDNVILTQKLRHAVDFINQHLAMGKWENVTLAGMYEASDTMGNRVDGYHKMRYRIQSSDVSDTLVRFNQLRATVRNAIILTNSPDKYLVTDCPSCNTSSLPE